MPGKQRLPEDIKGGVLRDPRDRVKAGLFEAQYPCGATSPPAGMMSVTGVASCVDLGHSVDATSMTRAMSNEDIQGYEWATYITLGRTSGTYHGIAYRARAPGRRKANSSRGSNDLPGSPGKPDTGQSGLGDSDTRRPGGTRDAKRRHGIGCLT